MPVLDLSKLVSSAKITPIFSSGSSVFTLARPSFQ
jgi:hypothetical protein